LTDPPYGRVGHDAVAGLSVSTPVDYVPAVKEALTEAAGVAEQSRPSEVRIGSGTGGVVVRVHGDALNRGAWSLVFRLSPVMSPVLVCTDDMPGRGYRIDQDRDWWPEIHRALSAVVHELSRFSLGGDRFPDPLYERLQRERGAPWPTPVRQRSTPSMSCGTKASTCAAAPWSSAAASSKPCR
jgi:hypothetical protein